MRRFILFLVIGGLVAFCEERKNDGAVMKLTLEEAKKIALEENPSLAITKARIKAAAEGVNREMANYWPSLDLSAGITRIRDYATRPNRDFLNTTRYSAGASASWLIFDGFQREFNVLSAEFGLTDAIQSDQDARRLLIKSVSTAFYAALLAQDNMDIAKEDADFNRILLDDAKKRHDGGVAKASEVKNFQLKVQTAEANYVSSEKNWHIAIVALGRLLAISRDEIWESLKLVSPTIIPDEQYDFAKLYDYAIQHRPDLLACNARIQNCRDAIDAARNQWFPKLSAFGDYGYERTHTARFNKHYDRNVDFGLKLTWNVFEGGRTSASISQAEANLVQALRERDDLLITIDSEIRQDLLTIQSSRKQLMLQEATLATAKEIRDLVHEEYLGGTATITRLNETQTDVTKAASERSAAHIQLLNSIEELRVSTGENLSEHQAK